jgi:Peptidyl-prolyl cis-trans isomerase (rotamase) - cyclophilin family
MKSAKVRMTTSEGSFVLQLDGKKAPKTVANFLEYVKSGFYNGTIFHRVMSDFMIQGGGFVPGMDEKATREPIKNEANNGLSNECYTIAMARTSDPHSATAQFFINVRDNEFLDYKSSTPQGWGYAVFGKVIQGTDTIDKIKTKATTNVGFHENVPREDIVITKAEII